MKKNYSYILIIIIVLVCGGLFFYFKQNSDKNSNIEQIQDKQVIDDSKNKVPDTSIKVEPVTTTKTDSIKPKATDTTPVKPAVVTSPVSAPKAVATPAPVAQPVVTPPSAPKNIFSNVKAGYSIELPNNWDGIEKKDLVSAEDPRLSGAYFLVRGQTGDQMGFSFDIQTSSRKSDVAFFKQEYGREPVSDDELFNSFIDTQKKFQDEFVVQNTRKTVINGNQAYETTASLAGGGGTEKLYVFYTPDATYRIMIIAVTSTWKDREPDVTKVVSTFKILK